MQETIIHENYSDDLAAGEVLLGAIYNPLVTDIFLTDGNYDLCGEVVTATKLTRITGETTYRNGSIHIHTKIYSSSLAGKAKIVFKDPESVIMCVMIDAKTMIVTPGPGE